MPIEHEIAFPRLAIEKYGPIYLTHLKTKGFTFALFLHQWASITEIADKRGIGMKILDLGCGPGWSSIFLAARGCHVTGADVAPDMLELARENAQRVGIEVDFREIDMERGPFPTDEVYDDVLIFDALHHCLDERAVLRNCFNVLRPGGKVWLIEPDWFHEYSPESARARRDFGTTERGMGFGRLRRSLRATGFVRTRRYYSVFGTTSASLWERLKTLVQAVLTLTIGCPHHSVIAVAERPI